MAPAPRNPEVSLIICKESPSDESTSAERCMITTLRAIGNICRISDPARATEYCPADAVLSKKATMKRSMREVRFSSSTPGKALALKRTRALAMETLNQGVTLDRPTTKRLNNTNKAHKNAADARIPTPRTSSTEWLPDSGQQEER
jgi:hypothetical protein